MQPFSDLKQKNINIPDPPPPLSDHVVYGCPLTDLTMQTIVIQNISKQILPFTTIVIYLTILTIVTDLTI